MRHDTDELSNEDLTVSVSDDGYVVYAIIDRPKKRNALNRDVLDGLLKTTQAVDGSDCRVFVIQGTGGTFSSGGDLAAMSHSTIVECRAMAEPLMTLFSWLVELDAISLAAIEGHCLAGGLGVASTCDILIADDSATFGTPEVNVGLFPMLALAPIMCSVHEKRGLKLLFTGELVEAKEAEEIGLVSEVVVGDFENHVAEVVDKLVNTSPVTLKMGKEAYYVQRQMPFDAARKYLREMIPLLQMTEAAKEGIEAFQKDRQPAWKVR